MSEAHPQPAPRSTAPQRILLATDLSCRCDRAQDRAVQLAERWNASLHVLHVLEGDESADALPVAGGRSAAGIARDRVEADMQGRSVRWELLLAHGDPVETILRKAGELGCDLVVTGIAREPTLGRAILGRTVDYLVRRAPMPVLVVRGRPQRPYGAILVATDFSEPSRHALETALRLFPDGRITLFHAYRVPFEGLIDREANEAEIRATAEAEHATFMAKVAASPEALGRISTVMAYGMAPDMVCAHLRDHPVDLVVLGTQGRTGLAGFLVGSTAERLLSLLPCDVMMVRGPAASPGA
ncbi:universal stress protein [Roseicella aerolata]|uniref:Universal stress protein n=1 Tax=Roseicella aerolata TaxID=2883479 RepID=A0A9X1IFZ8_9PROT|nr:universal stress protein [Roseicella aerolata]MCB4823486.1 universal stress protein [Roseicella aerolata]